MISRTLGPEFGGSIGTLFYFANVVSSALYLAACTEGIVNNFGPEGTITQFLPSGFWWNFSYSSLFNVLNLMVCLVGAKWFGRTTALILALVLACTGVTVASFFQNEKDIFTFEEACVEMTNQSIIPNCRQDSDFIDFQLVRKKRFHSCSAFLILFESSKEKYF